MPFQCKTAVTAVLHHLGFPPAVRPPDLGSLCRIALIFWRGRQTEDKRREERSINKWFDSSIIKCHLSALGLSSLLPKTVVLSSLVWCKNKAVVAWLYCLPFFFSKACFHLLLLHFPQTKASPIFEELTYDSTLLLTWASDTSLTELVFEFLTCIFSRELLCSAAGFCSWLITQTWLWNVPHVELWLTSLSSVLVPVGNGSENEPSQDGMEENLILNHCMRVVEVRQDPSALTEISKRKDGRCNWWLWRLLLMKDAPSQLLHHSLFCSIMLQSAASDSQPERRRRGLRCSVTPRTWSTKTVRMWPERTNSWLFRSYLIYIF